MSLEHGVKEKYKRDNPKSKKYEKKVKPQRTTAETDNDEKQEPKKDQKIVDVKNNEIEEV